MKIKFRVSQKTSDLAERETQADPAVKSSLTYTRITGKSMKEALIREKGYSDEELPAAKTIANIMNRPGYNLKRVLKSEPLKKIKEAGDIFENVRDADRQSDENPESLGISIDAEAKADIGDFS